MPATEYQRAEYQKASFLSRSIMSMKRNQVAAMATEAKQEESLLQDMDVFLKHVAERFQDLSFSDRDDHLHLSLPWLRNLLDLFLCCEEEFKAVVLALTPKPPHFDRLLSDLLDRYLKALDLCNAVSHALDSLSRSHSLAQLALSALLHSPLGPGQLRRAHKALKTLLASISLDDRDPTTPERTWSFGRKHKPGHTSSSSSSLSMSATWSASKQLQAMAANLAPPRGAEMNGFPLPIYTMSSVLLLVTWALVSAVPCQDRQGLMTHLPAPPRQLPWAVPVIALQEKIADEWRKKEKKGAAGLMEELQRLERCACRLVELGYPTQKFPMEAEKAEEMRALTSDLAEICKCLEDELLPFHCQVREVFRGIVRSRAEFLDYMGQAARISTTVL